MTYTINTDPHTKRIVVIKLKYRIHT